MLRMWDKSDKLDMLDNSEMLFKLGKLDQLDKSGNFNRSEKLDKSDQLCTTSSISWLI